MNLDSFVNKPIRIQTIQADSHASVVLTVTLVAATNQGIIVSTLEGGAEKFSHRFYPWTMVHYLDLDLGAAYGQAKGNVSRVG